MKIRVFTLSFLLTMLALLFVLLSGPARAGVWLKESIIPVPSAVEGSNQRVSATAQSSDRWQIETVDSSPDRVSWCTSLALDSIGRPHIGYHDYTNGALKYAWHDGKDWQIETVAGAGCYHSLVVDSLDRPHISYYCGRNLRYAWHDGTGWQIETVDSAGDVGMYSSLALDSSGQPYIAYYDYTNHDLKYARYDGLDWHLETVDSDGDAGRYPSLALDDSDRPHFIPCHLELGKGQRRSVTHR